MDERGWKELIAYLRERFDSHGLACLVLSTGDQGLVHRVVVVASADVRAEKPQLLIDWQPDDGLIKVHKGGYTCEVEEDKDGVLKFTVCTAVLPGWAVDASIPKVSVEWQ